MDLGGPAHYGPGGPAPYGPGENPVYIQYINIAITHMTKDNALIQKAP